MPHALWHMEHYLKIILQNDSTAIRNRKLSQLDGHWTHAYKHCKLLTIILWWLWSCWTRLLTRVPELILHLQTNVFACCELGLPVLGQQLILPPPETFSWGQDPRRGFQKFPLPGHCCHPQFKRQLMTKPDFFLQLLKFLHILIIFLDTVIASYSRMPWELGFFHWEQSHKSDLAWPCCFSWCLSLSQHLNAHHVIFTQLTDSQTIKTPCLSCHHMNEENNMWRKDGVIFSVDFHIL